MLGDILEKYGQKITEALKKTLASKDLVASGILYQSIDYDVKIFGKQYILRIDFSKGEGDKYAKWVEEGRRPGKMPPIAPILKWVRHRGLTDKKKKWSDNAKMHNSLAYLIARKIARKGTKPNKFFRSTIDPILKDMKKELQKELKRDIQIELVKDFKKIGYKG